MIAAWFGLLAGLGETLFMVGVRHQYAFENTAPTALFNGVLYVLLGALYCTGRHLWARVFRLSGLVFLLAALTVNDWARIVYSFHDYRWLLFLIVAALAARSAYLFHRHRDGALRLQRRTLPWMAAVAVLSSVIPLVQRVGEERAEARLPRPGAGLPNVVVVVIDTLRADHLSLHGYARSTDPKLTEIARQGVTFDNAMAPSSWTLPSHASMLTGRYPHEHGVETEKSVLNGRLPVIGEEFQKLGYRTGAFSANQAYFTRREGFGRGFLHFEDFTGSLVSVVASTRYGARLNDLAYKLHWTRHVPGRASAEDINERAIGWIDRGSRPFFLFLNYVDVHSPYWPAAHYGERLVRPGHTSGRITSGRDQLSPESLHDEMDAYDECIEYVDVQLEGLLQQLRRRGHEKDTIVVITSDHGEAFNEHGFIHHENALYRELIHVPLIFWAPGYIPAGLRIDRPVSTTALAATLLALARAPRQASFQLSPLSDMWTNPAQVAGWPAPISELARIERAPASFPSSRGPLRSVTNSAWHLILGPDGVELYACCDNRTERNNLADTPAGREIVSSLWTKAGFGWRSALAQR